MLNESGGGGLPLILGVCGTVFETLLYFKARCVIPSYLKIFPLFEVRTEKIYTALIQSLIYVLYCIINLVKLFRDPYPGIFSRCVRVASH